MLLCTRTTLDLPDNLLLDAKRLVLETRRPLRALVEKGLRMVIRKQQEPVANQANQTLGELVKRLYRDRKPTGVVDELLVERRTEAGRDEERGGEDRERNRQRKPAGGP